MNLRDERIVAVVFPPLVALFVGCGPDSGTASSGSSAMETSAASADSRTEGQATLSNDETASDDQVSTIGGGESTSGSVGAGESTWGSAECPDVHDGDLSITDETDTDVLRSVYRVSGYVYVHDTSFENLEFLSCLERIDDSLTITRNPSLTRLTGLERLESIGGPDAPDGGLSVSANPLLSSLEDLQSLRYVFTLRVSGNDSLVTLGLNSLETLEYLDVGGCSVEDDPAVNMPLLTAVEGLESLMFLGSVRIQSQKSLVSLGALHDVASRGAFEGGGEFRLNSNLPYAEIEALMENANNTVAHTCGNLNDPEGPCEGCPPGE